MKTKYTNAVLLLLLVVGLSSCSDGDEGRTKLENDYIKELRKAGHTVVDANDAASHVYPLSEDNAPIVYDIPAEGGVITLDYKTYSGVSRLRVYRFSDDTELSAYDRIIDHRSLSYGFQYKYRPNKIWVFQPVRFESADFSVDALDPMKAIVTVSSNTDAKSRHLYLRIGWGYIINHCFLNNSYSYTNTILIQQRGTAGTDERDLSRELLKDERFIIIPD